MERFRHHIPTDLYFGEGSISRLQGALDQFGKKVLLAYGGGSVKKTGLYDEVMAILNEGGFEVTELTGIAPNPRIESVEEGVALCKAHDIDVILAVGGGSVIDCAKAVAVGRYYEGGDLWNMVLEKKAGRKALPLVDILTMSATGTEFDPVGVITNLKTKEKYGCPYKYPDVSICDPRYTYTVPAYQTAAGSADIMSHTMEDYFSRTEDCDLSDGLDEVLLTTVIKNLPIALNDPENYAARGNLMMASSVACSGIPSYGKLKSGWPCHAMEHELSAYYDVTHGVGLAILTPRWMRFILKKDPSVTPRFVRFAKNVFGLSGSDDTELALAGIDALEAFFKENGLPMTLTELGIGTENFEKMAAHAGKGGRLESGYVPLTTEDVIQIFTDCL